MTSGGCKTRREVTTSACTVPTTHDIWPSSSFILVATTTTAIVLIVLNAAPNDDDRFSFRTQQRLRRTPRYRARANCKLLPLLSLSAPDPGTPMGHSILNM